LVSWIKESRSVVVYGLQRIGKTSLAQKLAERVRDNFPGGVLWWSLGPHPDVFTALDVWARHADPRADLSALPTVEARAEVVRSMLARLDKLCVMIDDVWDEASALALMSAVPPGCPILITTRDATRQKSLVATSSADTTNGPLHEAFSALKPVQARRVVPPYRRPAIGVGTIMASRLPPICLATSHTRPRSMC
jgi:hypothetical protein